MGPLSCHAVLNHHAIPILSYDWPDDKCYWSHHMLLDLLSLFCYILNYFFTVAANYIFKKNIKLCHGKKGTQKRTSAQYSGSKKSQTIICFLRIINSSFILCTTETLESIFKVEELNTPSYSAFSAVLLTEKQNEILNLYFQPLQAPTLTPASHLLEKMTVL